MTSDRIDEIMRLVNALALAFSNAQAADHKCDELNAAEAAAESTLRAALVAQRDAVLEEAAKVAERKMVTEFLHDAYGYQLAQKNAAKAIRALKDHP